jgi:hypothetical protein
MSFCLAENTLSQLQIHSANVVLKIITVYFEDHIKHISTLCEEKKNWNFWALYSVMWHRVVLKKLTFVSEENITFATCFLLANFLAYYSTLKMEAVSIIYMLLGSQNKAKTWNGVRSLNNHRARNMCFISSIISGHVWKLVPGNYLFVSCQIIIINWRAGCFCDVIRYS